MPLPIAHGLLGASAVAALHPNPTKNYCAPLFIGALLANAPDFDFALVFLLGDKHWHRGFSHSISCALVVCLIFVIAGGRKYPREAAAFGAAFASHFILDFTTTREGGGLELFFPFSNDRFGLGWRGLSEMPSKLSAAEILYALGLELLFFAPLLLALLALRNLWSKRRFENENFSG